MRATGIYLTLAFLILSFGWQTARSQEKNDLKPLINKWLRGEKINEGLISLKTLEKFKENDDFDDLVKVSLFDLNGDGKKELAVQSYCAAVGNCGLDVYIRAGKTYKKLLTTEMVQTVEVLKVKTKGFYDLKLRTHGSAYDSYHRVFKYNGKTYKRNRCWFESYTKIDRSGNQIELKKPLIKYGCGEEY